MRTLPAIVAVLTLAAECAAGPPRATITVDHLVALIDQAIDVRVDGLPARAKVVLTATAVDGSNQTWRSTATVTADGSGAIDLDEAVPSAGTYTGRRRHGTVPVDARERRFSSGGRSLFLPPAGTARGGRYWSSPVPTVASRPSTRPCRPTATRRRPSAGEEPVSEAAVLADADGGGFVTGMPDAAGEALSDSRIANVSC